MSFCPSGTDTELPAIAWPLASWSPSCSSIQGFTVKSVCGSNATRLTAPSSM